nr:5-enol-pyruvylshikimate-3-phospate synthase class 2 precursor [Tanacetum cinerariifolium]
ANRDAVLRTLDTFRSDLDALRDAVDAGDGHQLLGVFTRARVAREHFGKILARRAYVEKAAAEELSFVAQPGGSVRGQIRAFRDMGVVIEGPHHGRLTIHGVGLNGLKPAPGPIYLGNSGTSMRLLCGLLAAQRFDSVLTGDASLSRRPMARVAEPLRQMGAVIETAAEGRPP